MHGNGRKKRILVTGVAGFIGSNLAERLLQEGHAVIGADNLMQGVIENVPSGVDFHRVDVRSPELYPLAEGTDVIFHFAAKNCISDCQVDPVATADLNVTGTVNVFEAARRAGARKVIYAESSALYEGSSVMPTPESEEQPQSFYAISKLAGHFFAKAYQRYFGLTTTALRYFCVYGPRQDYRRTVPPVMSAFILALLRGETPIIYGDGTKRRDFVYVDDVNRFHLMAMDDTRTDNRVFNLGSGVNYSVKEILEYIGRLLGAPVTPRHLPDLPGEARETLGDVALARSLGWRPEVGLEEGLRRSIDYIRRNVNLSTLETSLS